MNHINTAPGCQCKHHVVFPILVILFGILFLLNALGIVSAETTAITWPLIVIFAGLTKLKAGHCRCYMKPAA